MSNFNGSLVELLFSLHLGVDKHYTEWLCACMWLPVKSSNRITCITLVSSVVTDLSANKSKQFPVFKSDDCPWWLKCGLGQLICPWASKIIVGLISIRTQQNFKARALSDFHDPSFERGSSLR